MKNKISTAACLLLLFTTSWVSGQVELTRIDGTILQSQSVSVANDLIVTNDGKVDINEFRLIDFKKPIAKVVPKAKVSLVGGGNLGASALVLRDEVFVLQNVAGEIKLGVDAVTKVQFKNEDLPLYSAAKPKEDLDQLFVKIKGTYQTVPGIVDSIGETIVKVLYDEDVIEFKTEDVFGLILAQDAERAKAEINSVVYLTEGSQVSCLVKTVTPSQVTAVIGGVADVVIPILVVSKIEIRSNRLAFLSDLGPKSVKNESGSVFVRKWQKDKSISGSPLVLRDREKKKSRTFAKGLGTKSGMTLVFDNNGFDRFVANIGIDASTNGNGLCHVKVVADGETLFAADVAGVDPPKPIDVDISGIDEVELIVEFGKDFLDLSDHVNWCDARFVKKPK